jgi:hypothetical protein
VGLPRGLFNESKIMITTNINNEKPMCTKNLVFSCLVFCFDISKISTQKEVVRVVKAESALENAAARMPIKNTILAKVPK